jgi:ABC-type branched-subunit amino acid transport system substrate-binding protein
MSMLTVLRQARKSLGRVAIALGALALAACTPIAGPGGGVTIDASAPVQVALLVPAGSGQSTDELIARGLQNAARLAIADLSGVKIDLRVYNTAGQPAQAAAVAKTAVADGAKIILGPVNGLEANAVGAAVAGQGINVLSFSNNADVAGGNVFVLGNTFDNTARRLASFAVRSGNRRIMIVHDQNTAGEIGRAAIERGVTGAGGTVVATTSYEFSQNGIASAAPQIAAAAKANTPNALFFTADTAGALPLITQLLSENGVNPATTRYMGLTRWDIPAASLSLPGIQNGWFALPDPTRYQQFRGRYQAAYGEEPHPIAGLGYDGIAAIGALVKQGRPNALTAASLTQGSGFVGVNGVFRLRGDGTNDRGLAIAEVRNGQVVVVDPAPRSFGGAGF